MKITITSSDFPIKINMTQIPIGIDKLDIIIDKDSIRNGRNETNVDIELADTEELRENKHIQMRIEDLKKEQLHGTPSTSG